MSTLSPIDFSPPTGGNVTINQGDSYLAADGNAIVWTSVLDTDWPDLTGATVVAILGRSVPIKTPPGWNGGTLPATAATDVDSNGNQSISLDLSHSLTTTMGTGPNAYNVQLVAMLTDGQVITLLVTTLSVNAKVTQPWCIDGMGF